MGPDGWFLAASVLGLLFTLNAAFPRRGPLLLVPSWIAAFLTLDLPFHHIAWQALSLPLWAWFGSFGGERGPSALALAGLGILLVSWLGLVLIWWPARKAAVLAKQAADEKNLLNIEPLPYRLLLSPFRRLLPGVQRQRNITFALNGSTALKLDVYRSGKVGEQPAPVLLYLHGGGWITGDKKDQGLPLCNRLAQLGWVCVNANYRLCPKATWPEPLVDAKSALGWIRSHAGELGADAGFVAVAGGSAGAHIASMLALTANQPELQPGFDEIDTRVQAVLSLYGLYDLTNRLGIHNPEYLSKFVGPMLLKANPADGLEPFRQASPREFTGRADMPWLVMHGESDTLAPVAEARDFFSALQRDSLPGKPPRRMYFEFPAAQHAFDIYYSHRALAAVDLACRFLQTCWREHTTRT